MAYPPIKFSPNKIEISLAGFKTDDIFIDFFDDEKIIISGIKKVKKFVQKDAIYLHRGLSERDFKMHIDLEYPLSDIIFENGMLTLMYDIDLYDLLNKPKKDPTEE